jgi:hypothetical protein
MHLKQMTVPMIPHSKIECHAFNQILVLLSLLFEVLLLPFPLQESLRASGEILNVLLAA